MIFKLSIFSWSDKRSGTGNFVMIWFLLFAVFVLFPGTSQSTLSKATIDARIYNDNNGNIMPYRILKPPNYEPKKKYPLVLCLHGAGGRGDDNRSRGTEAFVALSATQTQERFPSFIITPQCPESSQWVNTPWNKGSYSVSVIPVSKELKLVLEIMDSIETEFNIDSSRIYVTGQSMGGYGTWDIIMRYPERFAAAIPVCGAGDPAQAKKIAHIPIWAFHGGRDKGRK